MFQLLILMNPQVFGFVKSNCVIRKMLLALDLFENTTDKWICKRLETMSHDWSFTYHMTRSHDPCKEDNYEKRHA